MKNHNRGPSQIQDQFARLHPDSGRQISVTGMIFVLLCLVLFLHACESREGIRERESMSAIKRNPTASMDKRPIDASSVPAKIETATFALG
jgi:hypothetical protein